MINIITKKDIENTLQKTQSVIYYFHTPKKKGCQNVSITQEEFNRITFFMKSNYGVDLAKKQVLIEGRLSNKLRAKGYETYGEFMDKVEADPSGEEATFLVNVLTTNHTYFMREPIHFEFLRDRALPEFKTGLASTKDMRIWSAAASSGEEAYTIVMTIKDFFGLEADHWDTKVLATDVSTKVLDEAKEGIYKAEALSDIPTRWIRQHFRKVDEEHYQIREDIRNEVVFHTFNLMDPFAWKRKFHIIFLRNVMIYFDEPTKRRLIEKMIRYLELGGYLIIGTTETLDELPEGLEHVRPSIYKRV